MRDAEGDVDEAVDRLVRGYLERDAETTDASALVARVRSSRVRPQAAGVGASAAAPAGRPARRWSRSLAWSASAALALVVAFLGGRHVGSDAANAAVVLTDVQAAHSRAIDRCYRVQYSPDPRYWDGTKKLDGPSHSILWTRGDRFWSDCTIGDIRLNIGREDDGTLWVSPSRQKGIRFEPRESRLPEAVALICAINSMSVPRLVDDVLAGFDVRADGPLGRSGSTRTLVWATLKPGETHPLLSHALLEIDTESDVLVRLVLWMVRDGRPNGTVTYTLIESGARGDEQYQMSSHLDEDAVIQNQSFQVDASDGPELSQ